MIVLFCLTATSKVRLGFLFLAKHSIENWICQFLMHFWNLVLEHTIFSKNDFLYITRKSTFESIEFNWVLSFVMLFRGNNRKRKSSRRKKIRFAKLLFFLSRIICFVSLMDVFELRFRYSFVQNFTVLLLKTDFVSGNLWNRSYSKNIETGLTVNLYFLWSIFLTL
jgi:hypothetical protein